MTNFAKYDWNWCSGSGEDKNVKSVQWSKHLNTTYILKLTVSHKNKNSRLDLGRICIG